MEHLRFQPIAWNCETRNKWQISVGYKNNIFLCNNDLHNVLCNYSTAYYAHHQWGRVLNANFYFKLSKLWSDVNSTYPWIIHKREYVMHLCSTV